MAELRHVWLCFLLAMPDVYLIIWPIYWLTSKLSWWVNLLQYSYKWTLLKCFCLKKSTCFTFAATDWMLGFTTSSSGWIKNLIVPSLKAPEAAPRCHEWKNWRLRLVDFWKFFLQAVSCCFCGTFQDKLRKSYFISWSVVVTNVTFENLL